MQDADFTASAELLPEFESERLSLPFFPSTFFPFLRLPAALPAE